MFLSDRYVKGICPECGAEDQYGDNCEKCSATYNAIDLKSPISVISGTEPIIKESEHLFFKLSVLREEIENWLDSSNVQIPVRNKLDEWLKSELKDWDISRDSPYFGFEIPGYENKYFYVWLDAPIGYLASHLNFLKKNNAEESFSTLWSTDSKMEVFHFIGKDIMYFHALFFPVMLLNSNFKAPDGVFVHGFLTLNGEKMSKSRGNFISAENYINNLNEDYLRYFIASKLGNGVDDIDLNLDEFKQKNNTDLVNKYANIASRTAKFINKYYEDRLSQKLDNPELIEYFIEQSKEIARFYNNLELNKASREIMALADKANQYVDSRKPWLLIKDSDNEDEVQSICTTALNLFRIISILLSPIIPGYAKKSLSFLGEDALSWQAISKPMLGCKINKFEAIVTRIEDKHIEKLMGA